MEERIILRFLQISDLHITEYRNLLDPMLDYINGEDVDFVVATGDIANDSNKETIKLAEKALSKIKHKVFALPGDYDNGDNWINTFGDRFKSLDIADYHIEFLDTSFVRHRFSVGWANVLDEDKQQYDWLDERMKLDGYHIIFSHHPAIVKLDKNKFLRDNLRCVYSGHLHEPLKLYFPYETPLKHFKFGFSLVPMEFHGNACYLSVVVKDNSDITNLPKIISEKKTAW